MSAPLHAVVVGAGQAGLAVSYHLRSRGLDHLVVEAGHLWGKHSKAIPISWVSKFGEEEVTLAVGVGTLEKVPPHQTA